MTADTFDSFIRVEPSGCHEWAGTRSSKGYGRYRKNPAHREAYARANGPIPPGLCVCHKCDNPPCVNPEHLFLGTHAENMADMARKHRLKWNGRRRGAANPKAKLTEDDVREIRRLRGEVTQKELGRRYGIARNTVCCIQLGYHWKETP